MAYDPTDTTGYGGGLLSNALSNPLFNFGVGLLSRVGPSLTPQSGVANIGTALQYASMAQQEAQKNELVRAKLAESRRQQEAQKKLADLATSGALGPLPEGLTNEGITALVSAEPEIAAKTLFSHYYPPPETPQDTLARAQIAKIIQESSAARGDVLSETSTTLGNVGTVGEISQRLENSPLFAAGGIVDQSGWSPQIAGALKAGKAIGLPVSDSLINDAQDLTILDKATTALATNLQSVSPNLSRSRYALQAIQTAVASKMPWAAKREVLVPNLTAVFADVDEQGLGDKVPEYAKMKELRDVWQKQIDAYNAKRKTETAPAPQTEAAGAAQPPSQAAVVPGTGTSGLTAPGGGNALDYLSEGASAAPAPAPTTTPKIKGVMTSDFGIDPYTNQPAPKYTSQPDDRTIAALKRKGVPRVIVTDPKTGIEYLYEVP